MPEETDSTLSGTDTKASKYAIVDMHVHVGLIGDQWPDLGRMSAEYRRSIPYQVFLKYAQIDEDLACDVILRQKTIETIAEAAVDKAVLLALDPVFSEYGTESKALSHFWVSNEYVRQLCAADELRGKALFGCSVHPYAEDFRDRTSRMVDKGAVLMKWLPSAQQIDLAHEKVRGALEFLATAMPDGSALPLLLHVGPEYAIPSSDERTRSYDYLSWSKIDSIINFFRFGNRWHVPDVERIHDNIWHGIERGCHVVLAHCGTPYFLAGLLGWFLEHDEFDVVKSFLVRSRSQKMKGSVYADVSAFVTPFRARYFERVKELPPDSLFYGSDFPTPAFELSAGTEEFMSDLRAVLRGDFERVIIPQDNLLDVNLRELWRAFPGHPLFYNFARHGFENPNGTSL